MYTLLIYYVLTFNGTMTEPAKETRSYHTKAECEIARDRVDYEFERMSNNLFVVICIPPSDVQPR